MPTVPYLAEVGDTENAIEIVTSAMLRLYTMGAIETYVLQDRWAQRTATVTGWKATLNQHRDSQQVIFLASI
jgi:hypothetical protein